MEYHYSFKALFSGDYRTGKSSILSKLSDNIFRDKYTRTEFINYSLKIVQIYNKIIQLELWDAVKYI